MTTRQKIGYWVCREEPIYAWTRWGDQWLSTLAGYKLVWEYVLQ